MGMTIDECFKWLEYHKQGEVGKAVECIDMAIETMRKYQKIEQIINYPVYIQEDVLRYKMICEVVGKKNIKQTEQDDNEEDG